MSVRGRHRNGCGDKARYLTRDEMLAEQPAQVAYRNCECWYLAMARGGNSWPDWSRS